MQQSPSWEADRFSANQEIPHILLNPKVQYRIHNYPSPLPTMSQLDPVHTPTSYFLKIHLNIILPSTYGSPKWSLSFKLHQQNPVYATPLSKIPCPLCNPNLLFRAQWNQTVREIKFGCRPHIIFTITFGTSSHLHLGLPVVLFS